MTFSNLDIINLTEEGSAVRTAPLSQQEQLIRAAERLFAERGIDGVPLRQISAAAGNRNNSAVQYHFGTRDRLVQAIFEHRLPHLHERRAILAALHHPADLRSVVECHVLPILEQGEQPDGHYLGFVAKLHQYGRRDVFDRLPEPYLAGNRTFRARVAAELGHIPEPLRGHRIGQALAFCVQAAADRERARAAGADVLPFAAHVGDLLDGVAGFLTAPASPQSLAALGHAEPGFSAWPLIP